MEVEGDFFFLSIQEKIGEMIQIPQELISECVDHPIIVNFTSKTNQVTDKEVGPDCYAEAHDRRKMKNTLKKEEQAKRQKTKTMNRGTPAEQRDSGAARHVF